MISYVPTATVAGQPTAQPLPSRASTDSNPAQSERAETVRSTRDTARARVVTSPDEISRLRSQVDEGPGAEARRVNLSTKEFLARRKFRARQKARGKEKPIAEQPKQLAAKRFKTVSEQTSNLTQPTSVGQRSAATSGLLSRIA